MYRLNLSPTSGGTVESLKTELNELKVRMINLMDAHIHASEKISKLSIENKRIRALYALIKLFGYDGDHTQWVDDQYWYDVHKYLDIWHRKLKPLLPHLELDSDIMYGYWIMSYKQDGAVRVMDEARKLSVFYHKGEKCSECDALQA